MTVQSITIKSDVLTVDDLMCLVATCKNLFHADPADVQVSHINLTWRGRIQAVTLSYDPDQALKRSVGWASDDTPREVLHSR